ncbi:terminase large subunit domain-containing protein [Inquilinus sp.]|jgi:phage FluMu gp28-like protein|uniref:phage terminase large subunit family protein n=1 Tax=Inquilinus sp. TaxID=1932117 RepID=UPI0037847BF5
MIEMPEAGLKERLADEALLLPYQQQLLTTTAQHNVVICEKSRRIGFTWAIAADAVLAAAAEKAAGGMDVFYIAYEKEMTREFIDTCAAWAKLFDKAASVAEEFVFDVVEEKAILAFRIIFASGFEIVALSSKPRGLRGRQGYVIIDEAAFHDDLPGVMKAALALLMWGGKVLVISTHNGVDNPYNEYVGDAKNGRKPYGFISITFDQALADGLYRRICLVTGKTWSPEAEAAWRKAIVDSYGDAADEELFCIPSQNAGSWIPPELIRAAVHPDAGKPELFAGGTSFIGNDIARRSDRWVSTALERVGDVLWHREEQLLHNETFAVQDSVLDDQVAYFRPLRIAMDQTGMGEKPVEDAKRRYGELRVDGVLFTGDRQLSVATSAKQAFEDHLIRLPDDHDLLADIRKIKKITGPTGAPRLQTGRDRTGHADRAWALFLAIAAADGTGQPAAGATVDSPPGTYAGRREAEQSQDGIVRIGALLRRPPPLIGRRR